jgi:FlaA1/EpsC-like NDP-sugar epimerase
MSPQKNVVKKIVISNALILTFDIFIVAGSVLLSYLLRFNFSIPENELKPLPQIVLYITAVRISCFFFSKSYTGILKYLTTLDILKIYLFTILGSFILLITNIITYYFLNQTLFIPLTIIILEFIITTFLLFTFRGIIKVSYSLNIGKGQLDRLKKD